MPMKKTLIAAAAAMATCGAMAQSSVTLYGVADAGIGKQGGQKVRLISSSLMTNGTSRIGVTGREDLGGGLWAGFTFESGLSLNDGAAGNGRSFWNRQATVSLGGAWGTLTLGHNWTPADYAYDVWDLTGLANYNVVENMFWDAGSDFTDDGAIRYTSPELAGLTAHLAFVPSANHTDMAGNPDGRQKWDLALLYSRGPLGVSFDINKLRGNKSNYALGGQYDFGRFAVAASFNDARAMDYTAVAGPGSYTRRRGVTLGGRVNLDALSLTLDLGRDLKEFGGKKHTNGVFEAKYALSPRTFAYAAYLRLDGSNNYGMGLRHNF